MSDPLSLSQKSPAETTEDSTSCWVDAQPTSQLPLEESGQKPEGEIHPFQDHSSSHKAGSVEPGDPVDRLASTVDRILQRLESGCKRCQNAEPFYQSDKENSIESNIEDDCDEQERFKTENKPPSPRTLLEVRECNWEQFMNHYSPNEISAIEIWVSRSSRSEGATYMEDEEFSESTSQYSGLSKSPAANVKTSTQWIKRVRFQSAALLKVLSKVMNLEWGTSPITFVRPFKPLIDYHEMLKEELRRLDLEEETLKQDATTELSQDIEPILVEHESSLPSNTKEEIAANGNTVPSEENPSSSTKVFSAAQVLRFYIKFAEEKLLTSYNRLRDPNVPDCPRIRFEDLGFLFVPGELIFVSQRALDEVIDEFVESSDVMLMARPQDASVDRTSMHHQIWRLRDAGMPITQTKASIRVSKRMTKKVFWTSCFYLDYNGRDYGAVGHEFAIEYFEGERDITELEVYPLRWAKNANDLFQENKRIGRMFTDYVSERHLSMSGWTLVTDPVGCPLISESPHMRKMQLQTVNVEGEVIVDFQEGFSARPQDRGRFLDLVTRKSPALRGNGDNGNPIIVWSDSHRLNIVSRVRDYVVDASQYEQNTVDEVLSERFPYLSKFTRPKVISEEDDLALLPPRLLVFSLRSWIFASVNVSDMRLIQKQHDPFQQLQLPENHKKMIQAAVHSHIRKRRIEKVIESNGAKASLTQDLIQNKGRGLVILVHGEPGVGKTATAEAVALSTGRPLLPISFSPGLNLNSLFRLAQLWDCTLLMDEIDVFLSARSVNNGFNTFVSEFLSKVEHYPGLLFLTTNRIGKLDPALSSRMHLILHYKRLDSLAIENIFRTNIKKLQEAEQLLHEASGEPLLHIMEQDILKFATEHAARYPKGKGAWNGRQIRNSFSVAAALARHEANELGCQPQLRACHFQEYEKHTTEFEKFRASVLGGDDSRKARLMEERDDDYEAEELDEEQRRFNQPRYRETDLGTQTRPSNHSDKRAYSETMSFGGSQYPQGNPPMVQRYQMGSRAPGNSADAQPAYGLTQEYNRPPVPGPYYHPQAPHVVMQRGNLFNPHGQGSGLAYIGSQQQQQQYQPMMAGYTQVTPQQAVTASSVVRQNAAAPSVSPPFSAEVAGAGVLNQEQGLPQ